LDGVLKGGAVVGERKWDDIDLTGLPLNFVLHTSMWICSSRCLVVAVELCASIVLGFVSDDYPW